MAENIFDFRHVDVYCQYYSFKMIFHINQQNHYEMENALLYMADNAAGEKNQGRGKTIRKFNYCVMI